MNIGIDANPLLIPQFCGIRTYAEQLIHALTSMDGDNSYFLYSSKPLPVRYVSRAKNRIAPSFLPLLRKQVGVPLAAYGDRLDVFHFLEPYGSLLFTHPKIVTTVHDTQWDRIFPKNQGLDRLQREIVRRFVFSKTSSFIAISKQVQQELEPYIKGKQSLFMVYDGVAEDYFYNKQRKRFRIISFTDTSIRNNIDTILQSFHQSGVWKSGVKLTIITSSTSVEHSLIASIRKLNLLKYCEIGKNVSHTRLLTLYHESIMLVYPSLYEGFGMPILEAFASGCLVVTTNFGATKEVGGNVAYYTNPLDIPAISQLISNLITNYSSLDNRRIAGINRAKKFTWEKTAKDTLRVYMACQGKVLK